MTKKDVQEQINKLNERIYDAQLGQRLACSQEIVNKCTETSSNYINSLEIQKILLEHKLVKDYYEK